MTGTAILLLALAAAQPGPPAGADLVRQVRAAVARSDLDAGERAVRAYSGEKGPAPEVAEALSWLGRGALAGKHWDRARAFAAEARKLALELLKDQSLDAVRHLPTALGASIEVEAQALAAGGARAEAVAFLEGELKRWGQTSLAERIQKNIHLLSLEGKPAPRLETKSFIGSRPLPLDALRGKVVLLYFWAHWCPACKNAVPMLARLQQVWRAKGLVVAGPTKLYGFTTRGEAAPPAQETRYIETVWQKHYADLGQIPIPLDAANFRTYGVSTTPTLVLIDARGTVRLYRPGNISEAELGDYIAKAFAD